MAEHIAQDGKIFISIEQAARASRHSANYIARAARDDRIDSIGRGGRMLVAEADLADLETSSASQRERNYDANTIRTRPDGRLSGHGNSAYSPLQKTTALAVALLLTGSFYMFGTTEAVQVAWTTTQNTFSFVHQNRRVVMKEVRKTARREGIDGLFVDSLGHTASLAVDSFENGTRMIAAIATAID